MPDKDKGMFNKFEIKRIDGKPDRENCQYFVLDLCHDPYAKAGLDAYANALPEDYALLKRDLQALAAGLRYDPVAQKVV